MYYHLGLICTCCLDFFTMSWHTRQQHTLVCKSVATGDSKGNREESPPDYKRDDDGGDNFEFRFDED